MKEIALEKQNKINQLLAELLSIKEELYSKLKDLTSSELNDFEKFVSSDPVWLELEEKESQLHESLGFN